MATKYAGKTEVTPEKSLSEIRSMLRNHGATAFVFGESGEAAMLQFDMNRRRVRFLIALPTMSEFDYTPTGRARTMSAQKDAFSQAIRQRWRALSLIVKAKLVAVEEGVVSFEEEFFAHFVLPNDQTVFQAAQPHLAQIEAGQMPPMLPALPAGSGK